MKRTVLALFLTALPALSQNLIPNGGFDGSTAGWTFTGSGSAGYSQDDSYNKSGSGSVLLTNTAAASGISVTLTRCVDGFPARAAAAALRWRWGALPAGAGGVVDLRLQVLGYPAAGCTTGDDQSSESLASGSVGGDAGSNVLWNDLITFPGGAPSPVASFLVRVSFRKNVEGGTAEVFVDDVFAAPSNPREMVVPAAASIRGQNNTLFQTDLWALHRGPAATRLQVQHSCAAGQPCSFQEANLTVSPQTSRRYENFLENYLHHPGTSGALRLYWDAGFGDLSILTRTYSPALPAPTTGTAIPALETTEARQRAYLFGLAGSGGTLAHGFRTNVGFFNPGEAATVTVTLHKGDGTVLGKVTRNLDVQEPLQINDIFTAVGAGNVTDDAAWALVESDEPVFSYATVIDNESADSIFVAGVP